MAIRRYLRVAAAALTFVAGAVVAQPYPSKPVRLIVPWPPGGGVDLIGRVIAQELTLRFKQPFVVENRGGANSVIGSEAAARSPADGYTVMINGISTMTINHSYYKKLPYNLETDFAPVSKITWWTHALVAHPSLPAQTMQELIALAKTRPGELAFASFGTASTAHLGGELLNSMAEIKLLHVAYKGSGPALNDTLAGHVPLFYTSLPPAMVHIRSGKLRALAVTSAKRSQSLPDVIAMSEIPGLEKYEINAHYGMWVPAGTPKPIIAKLNSELAIVLQKPEVRERLTTLGAEGIAASTPEEMDALIRQEIPLWADIIKRANISQEEQR